MGIIRIYGVRRLITGLLLLLTGFYPSFWVHSAVLNINYTVTDSTISDGDAAGTIRDGTTQIGNWNITSFSFTKRTTSVVYTPSIGLIATNTPDNDYGVAGVGIKMIGDATRDNGVMSFRYTLSYNLTSAAILNGYAVDSVSFWGKYPSSVAQYGPAPAIGNGGPSLFQVFPVPGA